MTGAPLPAGADAVVQAEAAEEAARARSRVSEPVPPGRHVGRRGEDIAAGHVVLRAGRRAAAAGPRRARLGRAPRRSPVVRRPRVAILVTGDELLPVRLEARGLPHRRQQLGHARRPGAPRRRRAGVRRHRAATTATTIRDGGPAGRRRRRRARLGRLVGRRRRTTPRASWRELGELAVHGVALRPASPTGFGFLRAAAPVFLLPGNPVSCLCAYDLFAGPACAGSADGRPDCPIGARRCRWRARSSSAVGPRRLRPRRASRDGRSSRWPSAGRRSSARRRGPTASCWCRRDREGYPAGET